MSTANWWGTRGVEGVGVGERGVWDPPESVGAL